MSKSNDRPIREGATDNDKTWELRRFYIEQRDKHLEQLMSINGRLAFGALFAVLAIAIGVDDFQSARISFANTPWAWLLGAGIALLVFAIVMISRHHTNRIHSLESKIVDPPKQLVASDYEIIPPHKLPWPYGCIFLGLSLSSIGIVGHLLTSKDNPQETSGQAGKTALATTSQEEAAKSSR